MNNLEKAFDFIKTRKKNVEEGKLNGIPFPIPAFRGELPSIEKGTYVITTAQTKGGKSKFTNFTFIYNSVLYAYNHPDQMRVKILYFPLEETPEELIIQFMSYVLYEKTGHKIRLDGVQIKSTDKNNLLSDEVLALLESDEYMSIFNFFNKCVEYREENTSVGIDIAIKSYAREHGTPVYRDCVYTDYATGQKMPGKELVDYIPDDPDEFVICVVDHAGLLTPTREEQTLYNAIGRLSKNFVYIKNKFKYILILVQQQSVETGGLEARKTNNIRATKAALADNKSTGNDCTLMIGLTNPWAFEYPEYIGYDVSRLKDTFRVMEIILNRNGRSNGLCPLFFDGAVNYYTSLPAATDSAGLQKVYEYINMYMSRKRVTKNQI